MTAHQLQPVLIGNLKPLSEDGADEITDDVGCFIQRAVGGFYSKFFPNLQSSFGDNAARNADFELIAAQHLHENAQSPKDSANWLTKFLAEKCHDAPNHWISSTQCCAMDKQNLNAELFLIRKGTYGVKSKTHIYRYFSRRSILQTRISYI